MPRSLPLASGRRCDPAGPRPSSATSWPPCSLSSRSGSGRPSAQSGAEPAAAGAPGGSWSPEPGRLAEAPGGLRVAGHRLPCPAAVCPLPAGAWQTKEETKERKEAWGGVRDTSGGLPLTRSRHCAPHHPRFEADCPFDSRAKASNGHQPHNNNYTNAQPPLRSNSPQNYCKYYTNISNSQLIYHRPRQTQNRRRSPKSKISLLSVSAPLRFLLRLLLRSFSFPLLVSDAYYNQHQGDGVWTRVALQRLPGPTLNLHTTTVTTTTNQNHYQQ